MPLPIEAFSPVRAFMTCSKAALGVALVALLTTGNASAATPKIRTSADNRVPACVTPQRLMAFLKTRNSNLDPRYARIAEFYRRHGEKWHVRWDYAFFQMALETNFLTYRKGNGGWGDVRPRQNNFAGLGTTGGGVPGDSYPDVSTGVLAQIQHLVVYSGERIASPVGARTRLKQDDILASTASLRGRMTFADLARRWAADRHYGRSIEWVAGRFREDFCNRPEPVAIPPAPRKMREGRAASNMPPAAGLGGPSVQAPRLQRAGMDGGAPVRTIWSRTQQVASAQMPDNTAPPMREHTAAARAPVAQLSPAQKPAPQIPVPRPTPPTANAAAESTGVPSPQRVREHTVPTSLEPRPQQMAAIAPTPLTLDAPSGGQDNGEAATFAPAKRTHSAFAFAAGVDLHALATGALAQQSTDTARCRVATASYGGKKTLLVATQAAGEMRYTALTVLEGFERSMLSNYLKANGLNGASLGTFESQAAAIAKARELCRDSAEAASQGKAAG